MTSAACQTEALMSFGSRTWACCGRFGMPLTAATTAGVGAVLMLR